MNREPCIATHEERQEARARLVPALEEQQAGVHAGGDELQEVAAPPRVHAHQQRRERRARVAGGRL